jgi:hypothetical protein
MFADPEMLPSAATTNVHVGQYFELNNCIVIVREPGTPSKVATDDVTYPVLGASLHVPSRVLVWNK